MNSLLSYCGLTDAKMRVTEKDLPVSNLTLTSLNRLYNWALPKEVHVH